MAIKLFDDASNTYQILDKQSISIYNCGPTVYNHIHLGNARPIIVFDVLYRYLKYLGKDVNYIVNITDIDDKIIDAAIKENKAELELSDYYTQQYLDIKKALHTLPMNNPKVTDVIYEMIDFIDAIIQSGYGYVGSDGDVYFNTTKLDSYGSVSHKKLDELKAGARIATSEGKLNPTDFVLWKKTDKGIQWESPWGLGRPGWHTECVYLINKFANHHVDIHGGGNDLKFPHHENENAQNMALFNQPLADIWMHIGMINIDGQKMSKSLNNFILVKDLLDKYPYQALRWFMYSGHYASPINFSEAIIQENIEAINKIELAINQAKTHLYMHHVELNQVHQSHLPTSVMDHLDNNLSLPNVVSDVYELVKQINISLRNKDDVSLLARVNELLATLDVLGIEFDNKHTETNLKLIDEWQAAVQAKDFQVADQKRALLMNQGIL